MINGIKPEISTKTKVNSTNTFDEAMDKFCSRLEENTKHEVARFKFMDKVTYKPDGGRKFIKVKYYTDRINTEYNDDGGEHEYDMLDVDEFDPIVESFKELDMNNIGVAYNG